MPDGELIRETVDGVCWLTLNRPEKLNALTATMIAQLMEALQQAEDDPAVFAVALTGSEGAFCAGGDITVLEQMRAVPAAQRVQLYRRLQAVVRKIAALSKPVIAAVNGVAAGAGCDLAIACDLVFAAESAAFIELFVHLGLITDMGGSFHLPRRVGLGRAKEMIFGGEPISAERAYAIGLANAVVPADQLREHVTQWVARFRKKAVPGAVAAAKMALHNALQGDLNHALEFEAVTQSGLMDTPEHRERIAKFLAK